MDSFDKENQEIKDGEEVIQEEQEFGHTDKIIGLFTEPKATFEKMAKYPPKTIDWLLPIALLLIFVVVSNLIIMSNQEIAYQMKQKQIETMEKNFNDAVAKGNMTREQADAQLTRIEDSMNSPIARVFGMLGILIVGFIIFFIVAGVYFLFAKFALKGEGTYTSALVAYGMTGYIGIVQVILAAILAFIFGRLISDVSVASLINADKSAISGYLLSKLDIISIGSMIILSIALAKMFKSATTGKYYGMVFGIWIFWGIFSFWLGKAVPFLNFNR